MKAPFVFIVLCALAPAPSALAAEKKVKLQDLPPAARAAIEKRATEHVVRADGAPAKE